MRGSHAAVLPVAQMYAADSLAIQGGVTGATLMENAGAAVVNALMARWLPQPVVVLCGPGNNGGDGFVIARKLRERGWPVRLALWGERSALRGDAAGAAARWSGTVEPLGLALLDERPLVVDALFGAGLTRPLEGAPQELAVASAARRLTVVAVDVPSGIDGDSGAVRGAGQGGVAFGAALTVTFFRRKPGHLLFPGRAYCGEVVVADIGIPATVLETLAPQIFCNGPELWGAGLPWPEWSAHKYTRGHALIVGGMPLTGAARLAARAARRVGAGLVTLACPPEAFTLYALAEPGALIAPLADPQPDFAGLLADRRRNAVLLGPGNGVGPLLQERIAAALACGRPLVLDADALTTLAGAGLAGAGASPEKSGDAPLFRLGPQVVLTPHAGEFARLFPDLAADDGSRLAQARAAAARCGAVVVLKGPDTVIAAPGGTAAINANAPPALATAGSGDVLAGLVVGLLAQQVAPFPAACMAVWLHGAAAAAVGPGLIAEDLAERLPGVLRDLASLR